MEDTKNYLEEDFIIWNSTLGVRDFVTIGRFEGEPEDTKLWLDEPYDMVGPFSLNELKKCGRVSFAACVVMTCEKWEKDQHSIRREAYAKQEKMQEDIHRYNKKKHSESKLTSQKEHRELLCLPLDGVLEAVQIKTAFRKLAKTAHPDVGGSHENFVLISRARDILLGV
jgi:hypothetical protein